MQTHFRAQLGWRNRTQTSFQALALGFDALAVLFESAIYGLRDSLFGAVVVDITGKGELQFVPYEIGSRYLLENTDGGLEYDGIRESNHPAAGLSVARASQLHDMKTHEA